MRACWIFIGLIAAVVVTVIGLFGITPAVNAQQVSYWKAKGAVCTPGSLAADENLQRVDRPMYDAPKPADFDIDNCKLGDFGCNHAPDHDWYKDLKQPGTGYSCCSGDPKTGDCRPTRARMNPEQNYWEAIIDGVWTFIPWGVVIKDTKLNKDGIYAHICANKTGTIYCFIGAGEGG